MSHATGINMEGRFLVDYVLQADFQAFYKTCLYTSMKTKLLHQYSTRTDFYIAFYVGLYSKTTQKIQLIKNTGDDLLADESSASHI